VNCASVRFMIQAAYGLSSDSKLVFAFDPNGLAPVEGGPPWMKSDQYDIERKRRAIRAGKQWRDRCSRPPRRPVQVKASY
jgi:hypothetical protein